MKTMKTKNRTIRTQGSPIQAGQGGVPPPSRMELCNFRWVILVLGLSGTALTPIYAKEDFEPDNCYEQQGRPHTWNLCDYYAQKRLDKALEKTLPRVLQEHDRSYELFDPDMELELESGEEDDFGVPETDW